MHLANDQRAWQLALRAAVSLARVWQRTGRAGDAVRLVLDARSGIAEGTNLPDASRQTA